MAHRDDSTDRASAERIRRRHKVSPRVDVSARSAARSSQPGFDGPVVYDVPEVMRRLGITRPTLYNFLRSGELRSFRLGTRRLVSAEALAEFIRSREIAEAG
jgi:excisionase family DNA binding protein